MTADVLAFAARPRPRVIIEHKPSPDDPDGPAVYVVTADSGDGILIVDWFASHTDALARARRFALRDGMTIIDHTEGA